MRILACLAASIDGRIAYPDAVDPAEPIGSRADMVRLRGLRDQADAILIGGATFRAWPKVHRGLQPGRLPGLAILSRAGDLPAEAPAWGEAGHREVWIFTPDPVSEAHQRRFPPHLRWLTLPAAATAPSAMVETLAAAGVQTLLVEGGGQVLWAFLAAGLLDELHLTLCPTLIGGTAVAGPPGLCQGPAFVRAAAPRAQLLKATPVGDELFLVYRFSSPEDPGSPP